MAYDLRLSWALQPDQTHLTLAIFRGEKIVASIDLPPDSVLQAVRGMAELRQQMLQPDRPPQPARDVAPASIVNPLWVIKPQPREEAAELVVHHPGFGVLGFVFPRAEVAKMVEQLSLQLETPPVAAKPG